MATFVKNGNELRITSIQGTYDKLPVGVYNLELDNSGYFLTKTADFKLPKKIYGDMSIVDRWLHTYQTRDRNLGVLLAGLKGGGKTITAKLLAIKSGLPIITINAPYHGSEFISFISNECLGDCVIFLDEYEKIYSRETTDGDGDSSLLSVLDGPYQMHHLFILTVNSVAVNTNLINRPSRIFYRKNYEGLTPEEIKEIADDLLLDKSLVDDLTSTASRMFQISFDTLISIIEEVNRYGEPASQCILNMNLTPMRISFDAWQFVKDGKKGVVKLYAGDGIQVQHDETNGNPYFELRYNFDFKVKAKDGTVETGKDYIWMNVDFNDFKKTSNSTYEMCNGEFMFVLKEKSFYDYGYGYSNKGILKPKGEVPNNLIQLRNVDGTFTYSENYPTTIKILEESGYSSMSSMDEEWEPDGEDCDRECAG